jgi:hypothetical protein
MQMGRHSAASSIVLGTAIYLRDFSFPLEEMGPIVQQMQHDRLTHICA